MWRSCARRSTLGRNLGLDVVAEGVETQEIWDKLRELGCQTAQGYFLSRPVPAQQLTEWLERHQGPLPAQASIPTAWALPAPAALSVRPAASTVNSRSAPD